MATFDNVEKTGTGWKYNEENLMYDSDLDPDSGNSVLYNQIGSLTTFINQTKN